MFVFVWLEEPLSLRYQTDHIALEKPDTLFSGF